MVRRFCARCGRPEEPHMPLIEGLCPQCYLEEKGVGRLPTVIDVTICSRCGSLKLGGTWFPHDEPSLEDALKSYIEAEILSKTKLNPQISRMWIEEINILMKDKFSGLVHVRLGIVFRQGYKTSYEAAIPLRLHRTLCPSCLRRAGRAYEATLQLRGEKGRLEARKAEEVEAFLRRLPRHLSEAIGEVEEKREGIDLKILDQSSARGIASKLRSRFAAKVVETYKVVGRRRDGKPKVRTTILVRLPDIREGSIVVVGGKPAVVERISGNRILLRTVEGRTISLSGEEFWKTGGLEAIQESEIRVMMVTAVARDTIYLMDLEDYRIAEAPLTGAGLEDRLSPGDRVRVVERGGRIYILGKANEGS